MLSLVSRQYGFFSFYLVLCLCFERHVSHRREKSFRLDRQSMKRLAGFRDESSKLKNEFTTFSIRLDKARSILEDKERSLSEIEQQHRFNYFIMWSSNRLMRDCSFLAKSREPSSTMHISKHICIDERSDESQRIVWRILWFLSRRSWWSWLEMKEKWNPRWNEIA